MQLKHSESQLEFPKQDFRTSVDNHCPRKYMHYRVNELRALIKIIFFLYLNIWQIYNGRIWILNLWL